MRAFRSAVAACAVAAAALSTACTDSTAGNEKAGVVRAQINDENNVGVGNVTTKLTRPGFSETIVSDAAGRARFPDVPPGDYNIEITRPTGYTITTTLPVKFSVNPGQVKDVIVRVSRDNNEKPGGGGGGGET